MREDEAEARQSAGRGKHPEPFQDGDPIDGDTGGLIKKGLKCTPQGGKKGGGGPKKFRGVTDQ